MSFDLLASRWPLLRADPSLLCSAWSDCQPRSTLFELAQRSQPLAQFYRSLPNFHQGRVSAVLTKRSKITPQPGKLEKPAEPNATKQQSYGRVTPEVAYTCRGCWLHLCDVAEWFTFSKSQCSHLKNGGITIHFSRLLWELIISCIKTIPYIARDIVVASLLWVGPVLHIDLNPTEIMILPSKESARIWGTEHLKVICWLLYQVN